MGSYEGRGPVRLWAEGLAVEGSSMWRAAFASAPVRFCIFAQGRSGSTLLTSSLDSHPQIRCADEILRRPRFAPERFVRRMARGRARAFGFHVKIYQLPRRQRIADPGSFLRRLADDGWAVVHLRRRDVVAHAFSNLYAAARGAYHFAHDRAAGDALIPVDPDRFVGMVRERLRWAEAERAALAGIDAIRLTYEDDLVDPDMRRSRLNDLVRQLGLEPAPLSTPLQKSVRRAPWELMENAGEVRRALAGAGYGDLSG